MKILIVVGLLLFTATSALATSSSSIATRLKALEEKVELLESSNPKTIVESECLVVATSCLAAQTPYVTGFHAQYSYKVRQTLALAFENGTISNVTSEKILEQKFNNNATLEAANAICEKSLLKTKELITACL